MVKKKIKLYNNQKTQVFFLSLALEEPSSRLHYILWMWVIKGKLLQWCQGQPPVDNTIIVWNDFEQSGIHQSLRKVPTFQVNINNWAHRAVVLHFSHIYRRNTKSHLSLLQCRIIAAALFSFTCNVTYINLAVISQLINSTVNVIV